MRFTFLQAPATRPKPGDTHFLQTAGLPLQSSQLGSLHCSILRMPREQARSDGGGALAAGKAETGHRNGMAHLTPASAELQTVV
jgi:hypothetical protein